MRDVNRNKELKKAAKAQGVFHFKYFKVEDGLSTMKVGTDAVLLGAVADVNNAKNILEIGTGCGVIALIMAQRSVAMIDAIEIDEASARQAAENAKNSPWHDRVHIFHQSLQNFAKETLKSYDLVISNPPYFSNALKSTDLKRNLSRHNDHLSFNDLLKGIKAILRPDGSFWAIMPAREGKAFITTAEKFGLYPQHLLNIFPRNNKPGYRIIFQLKNNKKDDMTEEMIVIRNTDNTYTDPYKELTRDFYLDF